MPKIDYPTLHNTELLPSQPGSVLGVEWELYRREVGRLLAEGNEGKHIVIKGDQIIGLYNTHLEALGAANQRFLGQSFRIHQVQTRERVYNVGFIPGCPI
jgi:hypothetical protein